MSNQLLYISDGCPIVGPLSIGLPQADNVLYLATEMPTLPAANSHYEWITAFIDENGNHWRKILVILAKLTAPDDNWRDYLYQQLLYQQRIVLSTQLVPSAKRHLIAGKSNWARFNWHDNIGLPNRVWHQNQLLLPYPDYRQFPNWLIAQVRTELYG
ncbi:DUF6942 family protein [Celerinatantimonas yamalensis]|uniref:Uncharacterized protein n=1 Tax=Celerinatantimonas yamalensis TaxID=559956 RepID=A0ABW9G5A5_9GAMM